MRDKKAAAVVAVLVALPSFLAAIAGWIEADAAKRRAEAKTIEAQKAWDSYGEYIVEQLKKGCQ